MRNFPPCFAIFPIISCYFFISESGATNDTFLKYEAPEDCSWSLRQPSNGRQAAEEVALACNLRTINSEFDATNFSVIPSEYTTSLTIDCSDEIYLKSSLSDGSFAHLSRLRELILNYCKLTKWSAGSLAGLSDLRNLTVRTRNVDWPLITLDIAKGSFHGVPRLERLDFSSNNIWVLPEGVFCSSANLLTLNVSENRLQDVGDLGFREKTSDDAKNCQLNVRSLDASANHFVLLPGHGFGLLKQLQELRLSRNEIAMISDRALGGLKHLKFLDLSDNKIVSLPLDMFVECADAIREINLQNNSISVLSPRLFANLNQLLSLDLSSNQLTSAWINNETFSGLIRLVSLNLAKNRITKLDPTLFHDLYTLQILNLEGNSLESIPSDTFVALNNLHTLTLSSNKMKHLDAFSLNGLFALSLLALDNNKLESIHVDALKNCTSMQDLNLNGNKFTHVPLALKDMRLLKTLDLGENSIANLEQPGFQGMTSLYGLRLIANEITALTTKTLAQLPSLQILNLSQNRLKSLENGTFWANTKLEALRIDSNSLVSIRGVFLQVPSLVWLNISDNKLEELDYSDFPANLQWLDVHANYIHTLKNDHKAKISLRTLDASFNKLTRITSSTIPDAAELIFLNDNRINTVEPHSFLNKPNLSRVDIYANEIGEVELSAFQLTPVPLDKPLPEFYIAGNPFQCDCKMEWLQRVNRLELRQHPVIMDVENVYCRLTYGRDKHYVPLTEAKPSDFLCSYKSHCYTLCQCCVFDACDCEMNCPSNCSCYHDESWSANIVDCSSANYTRLPLKIPMDATEVYLDGNDLAQLSSHSFIGRKNLRVLFANDSNIAVIYNYTFSGLGKLTSLHLERNKIETLTGLEFAALVTLKELYLQHNRIRVIDNRSFAALKSLEILRLDGNAISTFQFWQFSANPYLVELSLSGNPLSCDCRFLDEFRSWVRDNSAKIADISEITCSYPNATHNVATLVQSDNITCLSFFGNIAQISHFPQYLPFFVLTSSIVVVVIVVAILIFLYKKELSFCLYTRCGLRSCYKSGVAGDDAEEKLFDAYLAYCIKDEDFVNQILCPNLETYPYRLCLHYRDFCQNLRFSTGNSYIADTIVEAAESSKRVVVILSRNFLQTEWCRLDYRSALREVLRDKRNKCVFVLLGEIPQRELDPDLRLHMKVSTCLQWGDNYFWQKFKYSMPIIKDSDDTTGLASFVISSRNSANIYATPFLNNNSNHNNGHNGANGTALHVGGQYTMKEEPCHRAVPKSYFQTLWTW